MSPMTAFRLGRISNLPTVWSNCLAGALLSGHFQFDGRIFILLFTMTLLYISGMFLNDAFDHEIDTMERPCRPIPCNLVSATTVFAWGFLIMLTGLFILQVTPSDFPDKAFTASYLSHNISAICLCILIVLYDYKHKRNPISPYIMGLCRATLYITAGLLYAPIINIQLIIGAAIVLSWTIGLTFLAKQETLNQIDKYWPVLFLLAPIIYGAVAAPQTATLYILVFLLLSIIIYSLYIIRVQKPGSIGITVSLLIASFSILDGLILAANGYEWLAIAVSIAVLPTLLLQRYIPGT